MCRSIVCVRCILNRVTLRVIAQLALSFASSHNSPTDTMKRSKSQVDLSEHSKPPPPEEEQEEFVVEKVKRRKIGEDGKEMFLIKWEGYPDSENTWEPREYLNCPKLIAKYEKKVKKRQEFLLEKKKRRQVKMFRSISFSVACTRL